MVVFLTLVDPSLDLHLPDGKADTIIVFFYGRIFCKNWCVGSNGVHILGGPLTVTSIAPPGLNHRGRTSGKQSLTIMLREPRRR